MMESSLGVFCVGDKMFSGLEEARRGGQER